MEKIKIGLGRIYNAKACTVLGGEEFAYRFLFGSIEILATIGPNTRHLIMTAKIGPPMPKNVNLSEYTTRARAHEIPSPEIFPADVYLELVATQMIEVDDDLAKAFFDKDLKARGLIQKIGKQKEPLLKKTLDYVAGLLGLRLHYLLVNIPIIEQSYAYRKKGNPYAISTGIKVTVTDSYELDISKMGEAVMKERLPKLVRGWKLEKASEILAWLLRAWATEDSVLKFISYFTALECVIPALPENEEVEKLRKTKNKILSLVKGNTKDQEKKDLILFVSDLRVSLPLLKRFEAWASSAKPLGWENDIVAFNKFSSMRNLLLHAGLEDFELKINITPKDIRTLEDIAERYVSLALFGDAKVYKSKIYNTYGNERAKERN